MVLFLTCVNIRSKPFIKRMFTCMILGSTSPNDRNWTDATYISKKLKNGFNVGICDTRSLIWMIKPFTEGLFQATFYQDRRIRDYALKFIIEIRTKEKIVYAGDFYFRSDRNPFEPTIEGGIINPNISPYLEHPYRILVTTNFFYIDFPTLRFEVENDEESVPPKPIEKTFKSDQCVICLEEEPKFLFCNCGHICICEKCAHHRYDNCPVCKKENTILRIIE